MESPILQGEYSEKSENGEQKQYLCLRNTLILGALILGALILGDGQCSLSILLVTDAQTH
jgi:hypothetical protein